MANETLSLSTTATYRQEFADFEGVTYFNAALQGPLPLVSDRAAQIHVSLRGTSLRIFPYIYNTREEISRLIDVLKS